MSENAPLSRSQRRLFRDIDRADDTRQRFLDRGKLSLPSGLGKLAIIVSRAPDTNRATISPEKQYQAFLEEAERLAEEREDAHQEVVLRPIAVAGDIKFDIADPEITDIMMIGHGSINCFWAEAGKKFDWREAARATTHLKQGKFEQRMCGNLPAKKINEEGSATEQLPHDYSVPLGTFVVSDLTNVIAAAGIRVPEVNPDEELFQPVYAHPYGAIEQVRAFNQQYGNIPTVVL